MTHRLPVPDQTFPLPKKKRRRRLKAQDSGPGQRKPRLRDKRHLAAVAKLPSVISGSLYQIEVCHIRFADASWGKPDTGMQKKPDDRWVLPLTSGEHLYNKDAQHKGSERAFWERHGIDALAVANALYRVWGRASSDEEACRMMTEIIRDARRIKFPK